MPYENPEPGTYWGYRCVKCQAVIALSPYREGSSWSGGTDFTLDCVNCDCLYQADYPFAEIRPIEVAPAA